MIDSIIMMKNAMRTTLVPYAIFSLCLFFLSSCSKNETPQKYLVRVDMSKEHDAGRFKPEEGDKLSIVCNFNAWKENDLFLKDEKGDWMYSLNLDDFFAAKRGFFTAEDTLEFRFVVHPGNNRQVENKGWEDVKNRKMTWAYLEKKKPVFTYNEEFDEREKFDVTFRVGMNNQKVLGFFHPELGDEVIVSGSFCKWSSKGVLMKDEHGDGIYTVTLPVKQKPQKPIEYRYRIVAKRKMIMPNSGWETIDNRQWKLSSPAVEIPYAEFNDVRRVVRFTFDTQTWEKSGAFKPKYGDVLQVRLLLDGKESLSDALFQINDHTFETALIIPLTVKDVQWQAVKNIKDVLTQPKAVDVDLKGVVVFCK
jgi:hypothetical protein